VNSRRKDAGASEEKGGAVCRPGLFFVVYGVRKGLGKESSEAQRAGGENMGVSLGTDGVEAGIGPGLSFSEQRIGREKQSDRGITYGFQRKKAISGKSLFNE